MHKNDSADTELSSKKGDGENLLELKRESKCPLFNRPKVSKLNRLEEFFACLVWNG